MNCPTTIRTLLKAATNVWRLWAKALGEKSGANDTEANRIAGIRTAIVLSYITTNCFIIAGVVRHWNQ
jgi:hypothetical protein